MTMTSRDITDILKTAHGLGYRRFRLEQAGLVLEADYEAGGPGVSPPPAVSVAAAPTAPPPAAEAAIRTPPPAPAGPAVAGRAGLVAVSAPMTGTFYRSPSPGAAPFIEEGTEVGPNDVVCIIEVMKLFNSIRAGVHGRVVEIAVANEGAVTAGQAVLWIEPRQGG